MLAYWKRLNKTLVETDPLYTQSIGEHAMAKRPVPKREPRGLLVRRRLVAALLIICAVLSFGYAGLTTVMGVLVVRQTPLPVSGSPADYQLDYRNVVFPACMGAINVMIHGWFIPGVLRAGTRPPSAPLSWSTVRTRIAPILPLVCFHSPARWHTRASLCLLSTCAAMESRRPRLLSGLL